MQVALLAPVSRTAAGRELDEMELQGAWWAPAWSWVPLLPAGVHSVAVFHSQGWDDFPDLVCFQDWVLPRDLDDCRDSVARQAFPNCPRNPAYSDISADGVYR